MPCHFDSDKKGKLQAPDVDYRYHLFIIVNTFY